MTVTSQPPIGSTSHQAFGTIHYHVLWGRAYLGMAALAPVLTIDGERVVVNPGAQALRLPAGRHRLSSAVFSPRGTIGAATLDVDVAPGAVIDVFHTVQMYLRRPGRLDFQPRPPGGTGIIVLITLSAMMSLFLFIYSAVSLALLFD